MISEISHVLNLHIWVMNGAYNAGPSTSSGTGQADKFRNRCCIQARISDPSTKTLKPDSLLLADFRETVEDLPVPVHLAEEHRHRPDPHLTVAVHRLIDDHLLQRLAVLRNSHEPVHPALEMSVVLVHKVKINIPPTSRNHSTPAAASLPCTPPRTAAAPEARSRSAEYGHNAGCGRP